MIQCPSCMRPQPPQLICPDCGAPLAAELDCFAALGLARKLRLDPAKLERTYHELSRRIHPDRFATQPAAVRDSSLRGTALLTRSYRTLRDPVSRGLYWLELNGHKLAENNKRVPPELAEMVFEIQEQLAELRAAGGGARTELRDEVGRRGEELGGSIERALSELDANFAAWDEGEEEDRTRLLLELKAILSRIAYLRTLLRDVDRELGATSAI